MSEEMQTTQHQPGAPARPGRYVVVEGEDGRRRVARADGKPLGTPFVRTTPVPERRVTARGFLAALRTGSLTTRARPATTPVDDGTAPTGEAIKARREALGLSQRELAALAGRARGLLAEVEKGTRNAVESRKRFGAALDRFETGRVAQPADAPPVPRGE